ncbi:RHS repeat domain-containing protein, partial [Chryseobacterium profundimaris]
TTPISQNGMEIYYTKNAFPTGSMTIMSVSYYDTYPSYSFNPSFPSTIFGKSVLTDQPSASVSTRTLPVMTLVKNIEDHGWTKSYVYYDNQARAIGGHSINHLGGYTRTETDLDFAGVPLQVKTYHKRLASDPEKTITETFTYDHQNRLLTHKHKIDNNAEEILTQNEYNELSQLKSKKVGGKVSGSGLQTVDYRYNIRGWMTQINDPANLGTDLFGYKIKYSQVEGLQTPDTSDSSLKVLPKFNGNIAEVDWRTAATPNESLKRYGYVYDQMNRLSAGFYQNDTNPSLREYYEKATYDLNGNIITMKRTAQRMSGTALLIDNLTYRYENNNTSNRLQKVSDEVTLSTGFPYSAVPTDIGYDDNGNMTSFQDKGISSIQYNYLNLPKNITQNAELTAYTYRADGVKVKKLFNGLQTDYLNGFQYKFTYTWEAPSGTMASDGMKLRIIPTSEGYFDVLKNRYFYNYTDHLGNVRLSYSDADGNGEVTGDIVVNNCSTLPDGSTVCNNYIITGEAEGVTNYYPFGMMHKSEEHSFENPYQYNYNGKELQETGMYDYGARFYMPDLGRWGVVDPLAEASRRFTPYHYGNNNPVRFIDPDGRITVDNLSGQYTMGSVVADFIKKNGFDDSHLPLLYKDDSGMMIVNTALGNDGQGGGAMTFTDPKAIAVLQQYFTNKNNSVNSLFDLIEQITSFKNQLEKANIKPDGKFKFTDKNANKIIDSIKEIKELYFETASQVGKYLVSERLLDHNGLPATSATVMQQDGTFDIYFATKYIKTNLDFSFGIFHEFGHILNERGMSFSEWTNYIKSPAIFKEEISVWKNLNLPAGDPRSNSAIRFYENLLKK